MGGEVPCSLRKCNILGDGKIAWNFMSKKIMIVIIYMNKFGHLPKRIFKLYISWLSQSTFSWHFNSGELVKTVKSEIVEEEYVEEGDPLSMKAGNIVVVVVVAMYALRVQSSC